MSRLGMRAAFFVILATCAIGLAGSPASAQRMVYEFEAHAGGDDAVIWRVDRLSGEVSLCRHENSRRDPVGRLSCAKRGHGAGVQSDSGLYALIPTTVDGDPGVFRVNRVTGTMSLCYDLDDRNGHRIVCTEPSR